MDWEQWEVHLISKNKDSIIMLINYFLVLTHTIKTITKEGDGYVYNPKLINNSKKKQQKKERFN